MIGVRLHKYAARAAREACARSAVADAASTLAIHAAVVGARATVIPALVALVALVATAATAAIVATATAVATIATIAIARTAASEPGVEPHAAR